MAGRILIVDPVPTNRMVLKSKLSLAHYDVSLADGVPQARTLADAQVFEAVLASAALIDHTDECALSWMRSVRATKGAATTFIFMHDSPNSTNTCDPFTQCMDAGADDVLKRPFSEDVLLARIRNLMRDNAINRGSNLPTVQHGLPLASLKPSRTPPANISIALVGADTLSPPAARLLNKLAGIAQNTRSMDTIKTVPLSVLTEAEVAPKDSDVVLLVAQPSSEEHALAVTSQIRARAPTQDLRVILIFEDLMALQATRAFDLGAHDMVSLATSPAELLSRIRNQVRIHHSIASRKRIVRESLLQAITDPLTGLYNRRYAASRLVEMQQDSLANGGEFAILAFDVDHFKDVNDRYGHALGDTVLTTLAQTLRKNLRDGDLICRTGGEEFLVALPQTNEARATTTANRLRQAVGALDIPVKNSATPLRVTVSIGLSLQNGHMPIPDMLEQADRALYQAKARGRNLVAMGAAA